MSAAGMPLRYLTHYFRTTSRLLFHPGRFFAAMPREGGIVMPLLFAIATNWLAAGVSFWWKVPLFQAIRQGYREGSGFWSDFAGDLSTIDSPGRHVHSPIPAEAWTKLKELIVPWFFGASSVLLSPFATLIEVFTTSLLVFIAARVLVDVNRPIRLTAIVRIICFASAPVLWTMIPVAGALIAPAAAVATLTIALMEVYEAPFFRALTVSIFPRISFFLVLLGGLVAFSWIAFRTLAALFGVS